MFVHTIVFLIVIYFCLNISSVSVIPERTSVTYLNEKFIKNVTLNVRRSSKRGEYVVNIDAFTIVPFGNNVTFNVLIYEHSSKYNQYIRSFIEFHYKLCDMIHKDKIFGTILRKLGFTNCPVPPGQVALRNLTMTADFDFVIPFVKGKAEANLKSETANEVMVTAEFFFHIKQNTQKG